ncbi:hypothetical protein HK100_002441 [Physocladia obscura]|uniref:hydroxyacylglutathione hydrolase n=1 Tax=Physocladia obscura TaxID=109957 RepID=A0AAD5SVP1_9FUNG|nr:hypothetical protein HK100_002441 [Physocladia obscura]
MVSVIPVSVNEDNYAYLVQTNAATKECVAVDVCEPDKIVAAAEKLGWKITGILTVIIFTITATITFIRDNTLTALFLSQTHHHLDHSGGNTDLVSGLAPQHTPVYGGDDRIPALTTKLNDRAVFTLGDLSITPLHTACHTRGSISYFVTSKNSTDKVVFTGDTLFIAGCGRFFEGTAQEMHTSLNEILGALPDDTKVYCGHEYTASNLRFAAAIEPGNADVKAKLEWANATKVTVPSTIGEEKKLNPFMRVDVASVKKSADVGEDPVAVMGKLREMKNSFK